MHRFQKLATVYRKQYSLHEMLTGYFMLMVIQCIFNVPENEAYHGKSNHTTNDFNRRKQVEDQQQL